MAHTFEINGIEVKTGDLICTTDGADNPLLRGMYWRLIGKLIPGDVDHIVIYLGPAGRCIEAGPEGVKCFDVSGNVWDAAQMKNERGGLIDTIYGVAFPLAGKGFTEQEEEEIRAGIAAYCLRQAGKPYNINFLKSEREDAFYCSQLAYKACLEFNIDLNTNTGIPDIPGTESIIYPQEIWDGCVNKKV